MLDYIKTTDECRSCFISNYFGERTSQKCGKCDNCLHSKKTTISSAQFHEIEIKIKAQIINGISVKELLHQLQPNVSEDIWLVLNFLESEQQILISEDGTIKNTTN
jgi:ATP-dependent DNA helicase RecQ